MRIMPPKGFYVYHNNDANEVLCSRGYREIIYTTGIRGGGGHKYCRCLGTTCGNNDTTLEWTTLLWSCVPSQAELQAHYTFYPTWNDVPTSFGFPTPPPDVQQDPPQPKPPHPTKIRKEDVVQNLRVEIVDVMKGLSNYGFFMHLDGGVSELVKNLDTQQAGRQDPSILQNGQHLVVTRTAHSRSGRGKYVTVCCEETGVEGDIYLCDLTQKCKKIS